MSRQPPKSQSPSHVETNKKPAAPISAAPTEARKEIPRDAISKRAYELFLARGGEHGHHEEDWQQAERELRLGRQ